MLMEPGASILSPINLSVENINNSLPTEDSRIRDALEDSVKFHGKVTCHETAATIFPYKAWILRGQPQCIEFSEWYIAEYLPRHEARVKIKKGKIKSTYFYRMINFQGVKMTNDGPEFRLQNQ